MYVLQLLTISQALTIISQYDAAKSAYMRVLDRDPNHAKVLQQLGWLHHQQSTSFSSQEQAIEYLEKSVASGMRPSQLRDCIDHTLIRLDQTDAQSWYLLGRCYMSQQKYPKAYEAYQQAVYRDGRNPTFWCSIGVLYYQINQYRDALDAYSRAIRLNPNISEVWYDLGTLVSFSFFAPFIRRQHANRTRSMSLVITRPTMLSMHTPALLTSIPPTSTSRPGSLCSRVNPLQACQIRATHHFHKTCILRHINQALSVVHQVLSGLRVPARLPLQVLLHPR